MGLAKNIRNARLRRRIGTAALARKVGISRATLHKLERGDPGVSMGAYAAVLVEFGLGEFLPQVAAPEIDPMLIPTELSHLPRRIRSPRYFPPPHADWDP